jgi:glycosyltransferase involved in cell wall biosynthesis
MNSSPTIAWFSYFPVEWLPDAPEEVRQLPRIHPASWQRVLLSALERLHPELRLHIVVLRKQFPRSSSFTRRNVTFHLVHTPGGLRAPSLFWLDTLLIRRVLRRVKPDLVHAWGAEQGAALIAKRLGYPAVVTVQGLYTWCAEVGPVSRYERLAAWVERRSYPHVPLLTTESTFSANYIQKHFQPKRLEQIEHAPDPVFHAVVRQPRLAPRRFLFIGRFEPRKGADVLLRALDAVKAEMDFELLIVGPAVGPLYEQLQREISPELWRRITFKNNLTAAEVAREMAEATLLIYPTLVDVSPNTVKEAVVAGLPVVASRVGGIPDYVVPGENGLLFAPGNLEECVRAIREAGQHSLFARGVVAEKTLVRMRNYLSPETMAARFWEAYQAVRANRQK